MNNFWRILREVWILLLLVIVGLATIVYIVGWRRVEIIRRTPDVACAISVYATMDDPSLAYSVVVNGGWFWECHKAPKNKRVVCRPMQTIYLSDSDVSECYKK